MPTKKKSSPQATPFLKTTAEAIGAALGKLAIKTGVATPTASKKRKKSAGATVKKVVSSKKKKTKKAAR
jgi:hypothetical protein